MTKMDMETIARKIRGQVVTLSHKAGTPHLASALSCVDILVAAYWNVLKIDPKKAGDPNRDRLIFSKGHAVTALYSVLCERGFFPRKLLDAFAESGAALAEQPSPGCAPGVEVATGSLGHGLSWAVGMALAARIQKKDYRVFAVLSDGECEEGSTWEAAMLAPALKLDQLWAVVDFNKWQATGRSTEIMALDPLADKFKAFGWNAREVDGHDVGALVKELSRAAEGGKPTALICHTVKGKGVSFMEDDNNWHYRSPSDEELGKALKELGLR
jgi:transketolase